MKTSFIDNQTFWYVRDGSGQSLKESITTDVVVVGGGMAGLSAAQQFRNRGFNVVVVEKNYCGSGASGKSSGFITPNSELSLFDLTEQYGTVKARSIWDFALQGVHSIQNNILSNNFACDYQKEATVVVAHNKKALKTLIKTEYDARESQGFSSEFYGSSEDLQQALPATGYYGGIRYGDSFGIRAFDYCRHMKQLLEESGVLIYEDSPVTEIKDHLVVTANGSIKAHYVIIAMDHFINRLKKLKNSVYHVQTFLALSERLTDAQISRIFGTERSMVWDTQLIYKYFRATGDNRIMVGGSDLWYTYAQQESYHTSMARYLERYFDTHFPGNTVTFNYVWPGFIGVSKDMLPVAGRDRDMPSVYYISAAAGLPWAAALGMYAAQHLCEGRTEFDELFNPYRFDGVGSYAQALLGQRLTFALYHGINLSSF